MGSVFRKIVTRPMPPGARIESRHGTDVACWTDSRGRRRTAGITAGKDGSARITERAGTYTALYRNGVGEVVPYATGCRSEQAALSILHELERRAELVKGGVMSQAEDVACEYARVSVARHIERYADHLDADGDTQGHIQTTKTYLKRLAEACIWSRLSDLRRETLEAWLASQKTRSARSRNAYLVAARGFANWCVDSGRLIANPFSRIGKANERADPRRQRRALDEAELGKLLVIARLRPLAELGRAIESVDRPREDRKRTNWRLATLTLDTIGQAVERARQKLAGDPPRLARIEDLGRERALIYKTLVMTGLRKAELESITWSQVVLDGPGSHIVLHAADEKNRQGATIPLRSDLAGDLTAWNERRLAVVQRLARFRGESMPIRLPGDTPLFHVPAGLRRILDRDLVAAGLARVAVHPRTGKPYIDKRDERGRTIDVHALRTTFGTLLSRAGVPLRTAQEAMRHSDPKLTANIYTDPKLLDVAGAMEALPEMPIEQTAEAAVQAAGRAVAADVALDVAGSRD